MASLRELEALREVISIQGEEINKLKEEVINIKEYIKNDKELIDKSFITNNNLSIIFTKHKQSLLVKNKYTDKNTTLKCKKELKEMGAKWFKNESMQGWLFVGICKDNKKSLEEECKFILDKLNSSNFNLEIEYE